MGSRVGVLAQVVEIDFRKVVVDLVGLGLARELGQVRVIEAGGPLELVERPIPQPGPGEIRIANRAVGRGVCASFTLPVYLPEG